VPVEDQLWVANLVGQHDIRPHQGVPPVRYEAIRWAAVSNPMLSKACLWYTDPVRLKTCTKDYIASIPHKSIEHR
jgi:hypothetical protein